MPAAATRLPDWFMERSDSAVRNSQPLRSSAMPAVTRKASP